MKKNLLKNTKDLEKFNTNIQRRVPIIISYLLLMLILKEIFAIPFPNITLFLVSFMLLSSLGLAFYFDKFTPRAQTIINIFFFYMIFDLLILTIVIYYLGGVTWLGFIFYSFYLLLNFMTFPRFQALFLTIWIIFLYSGLVFAQYFKIFPLFSLFPPGSQTYFNFPYFLTTIVAYISTFILVAYYSQGFYQLYANKISELKKTKEILGKEMASLEARVEARKEELKKEKGSLREKIEERKKELEKEELILRERAEELEKFQNIAVGREEKVKKLEEELVQLRKS